MGVSRNYSIINYDQINKICVELILECDEGPWESTVAFAETSNHMIRGSNDETSGSIVRSFHRTSVMMSYSLDV